MTEPVIIEPTVEPVKPAPVVLPTADAPLITATADGIHLVIGDPALADSHFDFPKRLYPGDDGAAEIRREILAVLARPATGVPADPVPVAERIVPLEEITGGKTVAEALAVETQASETRAAERLATEVAERDRKRQERLDAQTAERDRRQALEEARLAVVKALSLAEETRRAEATLPLVEEPAP